MFMIRLTVLVMSFLIQTATTNCLEPLTAIVQTESIHAAVSSGDLFRVRKIIEANPKMAKAKDDYSRTPLHIAAEKGNLAIADYLLGKGADIDAQDNALNTPLFSALLGSQPEMVSFLLAKGADFRLQSGTGSILRVAALIGDVDVVRMLINKGADPNSKDNTGVMPLHSAVLPKIRPDTLKPVVELLISKGAEIEAREDSDGMTPLLVAGKQSSIEAIELLIDKGASLTALTKSRKTLLHLVTERTWMPKREIVALLLQKGAEINAKDIVGYTPLHRLVLMRLAAPLVTGIHMGIVPTDENARKAIADQIGTIELMISKGANVNAKDDAGSTPLHCAASIGRTDIAIVLLSHGADLNARNSFGLTALHEAARQGTVETVKLFVEKGADINASDPTGITPLRLALINNRDEVADYLRSHGAK
ncbi:MAG TPA: ankyrin repeat domain-containing protein [Blastocatellia bacterium]|nr:ankyrin repeat domain-containing protein [Blastocatellia bacterium]